MTNLSGANLNNGAAVGPQGEGRESPSTFSAYPAYKDSGVEWLGDVPEDWSVASIRFFADLITGITPPSDDLSNYAEEGWSWVRPEDLDDSGKPVLASKFLTDQGWNFCRKVKSQSTLICCIGTIGKLGFIETDACTNQQITAVVPRQGGRFYFYAMHALKPAFDAYATGNVLRILNSERLGSVEIAVPSKSEAEFIARFLDHETARIDALIEEQQRLIELLKEKRQAVISHAVTKGLDPTVPMKDSGVEWLGQVPAHWSISHIKRVATIRYGIGEPPQYHPDGVPLIRATNVHAGKLFSQGLVFVAPIEIPSKRIVWLERGDIIVVRSGAYTGDSAIIPSGYGPCIAGFDMVLKCHSAQPDFIQFALLSKYLKEGQIDLEKMRAAQPHLNAEELGDCFLVLPRMEEQLEIVAFLQIRCTEFDILMEEAERAKSFLQERRSALISAAVTGKIDVRGWQPPASAPTPELVQETM